MSVQFLELIMYLKRWNPRQRKSQKKRRLKDVREDLANREERVLVRRRESIYSERVMLPGFCLLVCF